jgi:hypothetical protein
MGRIVDQLEVKYRQRSQVAFNAEEKIYGLRLLARHGWNDQADQRFGLIG